MDVRIAEGASAGGVVPDRSNQIWVERQRALRRARFLYAEAVRRVLRRLASLIGARRRRADGWALLSMSDRTLADIGLRRADAQAMAYGIVPACHFARDRASSEELGDLQAERWAEAA